MVNCYLIISLITILKCTTFAKINYSSFKLLKTLIVILLAATIIINLITQKLLISKITNLIKNLIANLIITF